MLKDLALALKVVKPAREEGTAFFDEDAHAAGVGGGAGGAAAPAVGGAGEFVLVEDGGRGTWGPPRRRAFDFKASRSFLQQSQILSGSTL